jgi:hypothetical protein
LGGEVLRYTSRDREMLYHVRSINIRHLVKKTRDVAMLRLYKGFGQRIISFGKCLLRDVPVERLYTVNNLPNIKYHEKAHLASPN